MGVGGVGTGPEMEFRSLDDPRLVGWPPDPGVVDAGDGVKVVSLLMLCVSETCDGTWPFKGEPRGDGDCNGTLSDRLDLDCSGDTGPELDDKGRVRLLIWEASDPGTGGV